MPDFLSDVLGDPAVGMIGMAIGAATVALWLAAAWWAYTDAARRTDSTVAALVVASWIVLSTPLMLPFSLAIYALARPQQTAAEHRTRDLAAELVGIVETSGRNACPACASPTDPAWLRCPACSTWLSVPCASCGGWSDRTLPACPWCGAEERAQPAAELLEPAGSGRPLRARRVRRALRPVGPGGAVGPRPQRRILAPDGRPLAPLRSR